MFCAVEVGQATLTDSKMEHTDSRCGVFADTWLHELVGRQCSDDRSLQTK
jgi:hypothetical protein